MKAQPLYKLWNIEWKDTPVTDYTIGIDTIENMLAKMKAKPWPVYKIKVGTENDIETITALRKNTDAVFRVDANAGWALDEALEKFNAVKNQDSQYSPAANYYAGFIEYSKGNYTDAFADLKRAEASQSYANIVPSLIANVYYKQRKYDDLIRYASSLEPRSAQVSNYSEISMLVADAYYYKQDYTKAAAAYEVYLESNQAKAENALRTIPGRYLCQIPDDGDGSRNGLFRKPGAV